MNDARSHHHQIRDKNGVYQFNRTHCGMKYVGQTDRSFSNRFKEHDRSFRFKSKESKLSIESSALEDGRSYRTKHV